MKARKKAREARKLSFVLVGGSAYFLGVCIIEGLKLAGVSVYLAQIPAFVLGATYTWWLNRRFTYAVRESPSAGEYARYMLSSTASLAVSMGVFSLFTLGGASVFIGLAAGTLCGLLLNYWSYGRFAFKR